MHEMIRAVLAATALVLGLAGSALANTGQFIGDWVNVDSNTGGITRVVVTPAGPNRVRVQVFGKCHPNDCDWGTVAGKGYANSASSNDIRTVTAEFSTGFGKTLVILRPISGGLSYSALTDFTDNSGRKDYESSGTLRAATVIIPVPLPQPIPLPAPGVLWGPEDCIGFNPMQVQAVLVGGHWKVVQGAMSMIDFGNNAAGAMRAVKVIKAYGFSQQCFVKRPNAAMMYWKVGNSVPSNGMPSQDCVSNNPATTSVAKVGGSWKVVDGGHSMLDFGSNKAAADQALSVIRHYNLNRQCFVARPNAPMSYWLSQ